MKIARQWYKLNKMIEQWLMQSVCSIDSVRVPSNPRGPARDYTSPGEILLTLLPISYGSIQIQSITQEQKLVESFLS